MEREEPQKKKQKHSHPAPNASTRGIPNGSSTTDTLDALLAQPATPRLTSLSAHQLEDLAREACVRLKTASRHDKEALFRTLESLFEAMSKLTPSQRNDSNGTGPSSSVRSTSDVDTAARYCVSVLLQELDNTSNTVRTYAAKLLCRLLEKPKDANTSQDGEQQQKQKQKQEQEEHHGPFPQAVVVDHFLRNEGVPKALFLLGLPVQRVRYYALRLLSSQPQRFADEFVRRQGTRALSSTLSDIPKLVEDSPAVAAAKPSRPSSNNDSTHSKSDNDNNVSVLACTLLQQFSKTNADILDEIDVPLLFTAWSACIEAVLRDLPVANKDRLVVSLTVVLLKSCSRSADARAQLCSPNTKRYEQCIFGSIHYMHRLASSSNVMLDPTRHRQNEQYAYMLDNLLRVLLAAAVDTGSECAAKTKHHHETILLSCTNFLCAILYAPLKGEDVARIGTQELIELPDSTADKSAQTQDNSSAPSSSSFSSNDTTTPLLPLAFRSRPPLLTVLLDLIIHCVRVSSSKPPVRRVASSLASSVRLLMTATIPVTTTDSTPPTPAPGASETSGAPARLLKLATFLLNYPEGVAVLITLPSHLNQALWSSLLPLARAGLDSSEQDPTPATWNKRLRALATLDHATRHHPLVATRVTEAGGAELVMMEAVPDLSTGPSRAAWTRFARFVTSLVGAVNVKARLREKGVVAVIMRVLCLAIREDAEANEKEKEREKEKEKDKEVDDKDRVLELATREDVIAACLGVVKPFKHDTQGMQVWATCPVPTRPSAASGGEDLEADRRWADMWREATLEAGPAGKNTMSLVPILLKSLFPWRSTKAGVDDNNKTDLRAAIVQDAILLLDDLVAYPSAQELVLRDSLAIDDLARFIARCADSDTPFGIQPTDTDSYVTATRLFRILVRSLTSPKTLKTAVLHDAYTQAFAPLVSAQTVASAALAARLSAAIHDTILPDLLRLLEYASRDDSAAKMREYTAVAIAYGCPPSEWRANALGGKSPSDVLYAESMAGVLSKMLTCELEIEGQAMDVDEESEACEKKLARESMKRRAVAAQAIEYLAGQVAAVWDREDLSVEEDGAATFREKLQSADDTTANDVITFVLEDKDAVEAGAPRASRALLAAASPIFLAMLQGQYAESTQSHVTIRDVQTGDMVMLIECIEALKRGETVIEVLHRRTVSWEQVVGLLKTADRFVVELVKRECEKWIINKLKEGARDVQTAEGAVVVLEMCKGVGKGTEKAEGSAGDEGWPYATVIEAALRHLARNMTVVCGTKGFQRVVAHERMVEVMCEEVWRVLTKAAAGAVSIEEKTNEKKDEEKESVVSSN
ncbi:hypothetical protein BC937DRAFT_87249 [Endogone sp. FLAS-F59071]|nr:hypothetical protein BC937DRAFT_87249 [Endogone sp. FLAS-F59071]|eukprot:RUS22752.1 hypothetical protein BC937DRAFT_87249 [Endogone sp. FLAS-F59071]